MANVWISFLKSWRARNKGVSMKDSMKRAAVEYKKQKGTGKGTGEKKKQKNQEKGKLRIRRV